MSEEEKIIEMCCFSSVKRHAIPLEYAINIGEYISVLLHLLFFSFISALSF
jgi:hypothetical protein